MDYNYPASLAATLRYEGGYSNHPSDPGGPTMKGVTQRVYDAWRKKRGLAPRSVRQLEQSELEAIYRRDYWDRCKCDDLPGGVDLAVFDFAVNSGPVRAIKYLQRVVGVTQDGVVGPHTIAAAAAAPNCAVRLCDARLAFMRSLHTWNVFGKGWNDRMVDVRKKSAALAAAKPRTTQVAEAPKVIEAPKVTRTRPSISAKAEPVKAPEVSIFEEIGNFFNPKAPKPVEIPPEVIVHADDALHRYLTPALIAFTGALASADWNTALDNPSASIAIIVVGAASAAYKAAAPWYLRAIWKGPTIA